MEAEDLVAADDLWWSWAVLTDQGLLPDGATSELDADAHVLTFRSGDSWVSMQRFGGGRAVLWGRVAGSPAPGDVLEGCPDWASSDAVSHSTRESPAGFLAWYSRDGWEGSGASSFDRLTGLMLPLLGADPRLVEAARGQDVSPLLTQARGTAQVAVQGSIRRRLRDQVHRQMRDTREIDRDLPERPVLLARWVRITEPAPFEYAVLTDRDLLVPAYGGLPPAATQSLHNVLMQLHRDEAGEESGAWLVAVVRYAGGRITLQRAFDSLPAWYRGRGPTLLSLGWEMRQRHPRWRPAWASLLPD